MLEHEIYNHLDQIFRDIIGDESIKLEPQTTASDVEGWDSVTHVSLIVSIETQFRIKIRTDEMEGLKNVGEMVALIERRTS